MKKRVVSLSLILTLLFTGIMPVKADKSATQAVINKMLTYSTEDRQNLLLFAIGMFATDGGIDVLVDAIADYKEGDSGMFSDMIASVLRIVDKGTAISAMNGVKLIKSNIRYKYIQAFKNRLSLTLTDSSREHLQYFIQKAWDDYNGLERLMTEDGITVDVVAYMLQIVLDINDGGAIVTDNQNNNLDFGIYKISREVKQNINSTLSNQGLDNVDKFIEEYITKLNSKFSDDEKQMIKAVGQEIGFYTPLKSIISSGFSSEIIYKNESQSEEIIVNKVESQIDVFEVAFYKNGIKQEYSTFDKPYLVKIPVEDMPVMVYKLSEKLEPVKYSIYSDNMIYMLENTAGLYYVEAVDDHFTDSDGWGNIYIESLYRRGIISGKGESLFMPDDNITREEFVKLVVELFDFDDRTYYTNFTDVVREQWYYPYIAVAYTKGIISGVGNNRFGVGENILRQDICRIIDSVIKTMNITAEFVRDGAVFVDGDQIDAYAAPSVYNMHKYGIVSGSDNGYFYPKNYATRQEAAKIIYGILELYIKSQ